MSCAEWYRWFGEHDARGRSPSYAALSLAVADDGELCRLIDALPSLKQQPNLLFAATRSLGGPTHDWPEFRSFVTTRWAEVSALMATRSTQTNEAARCASLLPILAALPQPLALIELGTSAGLCLYPDRYQYRYGDRVLGESPVQLDVEISGAVPVPDRLPEVVARIGVDLEPRDVTDTDDMAWLRACIWPEQTDRHVRFEAAVAIAATEPPELHRGDLVEAIPDLIDRAPAAATTVVFNSTAFMYLTEAQRHRATELLAGRNDVVWITNESPGLVPGLATDLTPPPGQNQQSYLEVAVGGTQVRALTGPHGSWLWWPPPTVSGGR
ncbi:MAG: DUF2332 domain-containing protein [Acidimicrobiales bacterium]